MQVQERATNLYRAEDPKILFSNELTEIDTRLPDIAPIGAHQLEQTIHS
jgi:hypothetical protein